MRSPSEHIKTLQRRVDFLRSREHQNSYDLAELGSLEWALINLPSNNDVLKRMCSDMWQIMHVCQVAFNHLPNQRTGHADYPETYDLAVQIDQTIKEYGDLI
jgi:hypothetical protein